MKKLIYAIAAVALLMTSCYSNKAIVSTTVRNNISNAMTESERYIVTYYPVAVEQMERHGIPASITLAQALLEGGAGKSDLVENANNHFGVKADKRWNGNSYSKWDNGKWCQFRVYKSAEESFEDHSEFLLSNSRYDFLFKLRKDDYKGWAKGLKDAGYAEDRQYDTKLINIIERYGLQQYDTSRRNSGEKQSYTDVYQGFIFGRRHELLKMNGLIYTIAKDGDTFEGLSEELGISKRKIRKYNDMYKRYTLKDGEIVYLKRKKNKARRGNNFHTINGDETMHYISQMYGIKLKRLYKMNPIYKGYANIKAGDIIRLR